MSDIVDLAIATLSQAEKRVEIAAQNMANATTPAYKRKVAFSTLIENQQSRTTMPRVSAATDFKLGKLVQTNKPHDLAIAGQGYFAVRYDNRVTYTRTGQFSADAEGRLVNDQGGVLQLVNGSDAIVKASDFKVQTDGTINEKGESSGKIAVYSAAREADMIADKGGLSAGTTSLTLFDDARVQQGAYEASNVNTGDEMVLMMEALRRAESGQRIMTTYDDMLGRAINSFGESGR